MRMPPFLVSESYSSLMLGPKTLNNNRALNLFSQRRSTCPLWLFRYCWGILLYSWLSCSVDYGVLWTAEQRLLSMPKKKNKGAVHMRCEVIMFSSSNTSSVWSNSTCMLSMPESCQELWRISRSTGSLLPQREWEDSQQSTAAANTSTGQPSKAS